MITEPVRGRPYLVAPECITLAKHFIAADMGSRTMATAITLDMTGVGSLAEAIQKSVETWFQDNRQRNL